MRLFGTRRALLALALTPALMAMQSAFAQGDIHKVKHVIIVMQENHSFDNYFGALAYAPGSPYHTPGANGAMIATIRMAAAAKTTTTALTVSPASRTAPVT